MAEAAFSTQPFVALGEMLFKPEEITKHPQCRITENTHTGDHDCGYNTTLTCDECKYGRGRKNPEAKCNQAQ